MPRGTPSPRGAHGAPRTARATHEARLSRGDMAQHPSSGQGHHHSPACSQETNEAQEQQGTFSPPCAESTRHLILYDYKTIAGKTPGISLPSLMPQKEMNIPSELGVNQNVS